MPGAWRSLTAWQLVDDVFLEVHKLTKAFPADERFVLTAQIRRAALSIPTNIVEGTARFGPKERVQFLRTAWASLAELEYLLFVAERLSYVPKPRADALGVHIQRCGGAIRGLISKIETESSTSRRCDPDP